MAPWEHLFQTCGCQTHRRQSADHVFDTGTGKTEEMKMMEVMTLPCAVTSDQRQAAKREIVRQMEQGMTATEARLTSSVPMHRTTVYRLLKRVEREGEQALAERRHGYPTKLRGEILTWMLDYCQNHRTTSSADVQRRLSERFNFSVSISQLNRVRTAHGLSRQPLLREKKPKTGLTMASGYHEQAGGLLLLAAATETGLLTQLEQDLLSSPDPTCFPLAGSAAVHRRLLLTVLFLGAVGL
jgi:transposase